MAKVVIAELDIDINALLKSTSQLKNEIDKLKEVQKSLAKEGDTSSKAFVQNAADLRTLQGAYSSNIKAISENTQAQADSANASKLVALALSSEVTSIAEAREQNKLLNKLRNDTNVTTAEGKKQLEDLNVKLDSNNEFIKENADAYLKQKINIGNYSDSIKEALSNINPLNGGMAGFTQRAQEAGGVGNLLKTSLAGVGQGIMGVVKSSLAFIATPIGAVIAAVALAVGILYSAFKQFQPVVDKVEQVFAGLSAIMSVVKNTVIALVTGTKSLSSAFSGLSGDINDAYESSVKLKKAQQDLEDAMKEQELQSAKNRSEINRLNIQAKDRTKSDEERIALLEKSAKLEEVDFQQRKKNNDEAVRQAYEQIRIEGTLTDKEFAELKKRGLAYKDHYEKKGTGSDELFDKLQSALIAETNIQNEFYSNQEKNINKQNKLIEDAEAEKEKQREKAKAAAEKEQARIQKANEDLINRSRQEIELFIAQQSIKQKSIEEEYNYNKSIYDKESKDLELRYKKGKVSKLEYETEKLNLSSDYAQKNADTMLQFANAELNLFLETNKSKLIGEKFLSDELIKEEERRLKEIEKRKLDNLAKEKGVDAQKIADKKLNNEALTLAETEYETTRIALAGETDATIKLNKKTLDDQTKQQEAEQLLAQKEIDLANAETELEEALLSNQFKYDAELAQLTLALENKKLTQDQYTEKKKQADAKLAELDKKAQLTDTAGKLNELKRVGEGLEGLFGKSKGIAAATALINGGLAVTNILATKSTFPEPAASIFRGVQIAAAAATTARSIAQINGAKFEKGGIQEIGGKRHSGGGTKFYGEDGTMFEAERGEGIGVLNRSAFSSFMDFNNRFNGGSSNSGFMAGGGIITQGVRPESQNLDFIVDAIASIPAPIVAVEEIQSVGNRYVSVKNGADL